MAGGCECREPEGSVEGLSFCQALEDMTKDPKALVTKITCWVSLFPDNMFRYVQIFGFGDTVFIKC